MYTRTSAALALATAALALGACGGDDGGGGGDEGEVREVVTQLINSDEAACDNVTDDFLESVDATEEECRESAGGDAPDPMPEIGEITVDGEEATAIVTDEDRSTVELVKRDGEWLVDRLDVEEGAGDQGE